LREASTGQHRPYNKHRDCHRSTQNF
jgi:hypothetical protein